MSEDIAFVNSSKTGGMSILEALNLPNEHFALVKCERDILMSGRICLITDLV